MIPTGHLFAGIHGYGYGLDAVGYSTEWAVEYADFPRRILELRAPGDLLKDVREVSHPPAVAGVTGGFPCQDLSNAGHGAGIHGKRSGLYRELVRIVGEVGPEVVFVENVPALLHRGFEHVLGDLVALGYNVEWDCLPAAAFGAPHLRDRVWVVAHRHPEPFMFGQPAALFPLPPAEATAVVGDDGDEDGATSWQRFPRAGWVNGDHGLVMPLQPLAPVPAVKSGHRVPTPIARDWKGAGHEGQLGTVAARGLWPTPIAGDAVGTRNATARRPNGSGNHHAGTTLLDALILSGHASMPATGVWPTPKASPSGPDYARAGRDDLATAVARGLYKTPRASEGDHPGRTAPPDSPYQTGAAESANAAQRAEGKQTGALNPDWVEWLMGFPLGWTNPDTPPEDLVAHPWDLGEPPGIPRVAANVPHRRERLTALGNALVPIIPAWLGARYAAHAAARRAA